MGFNDPSRTIRPRGRTGAVEVLLACTGLALAAILCGAVAAAGAAGGPAGRRELEAGTIEGRVVHHGTPPALAPVPVWKHREFCGAERVPAALRIGPGGAVADALLVLEGDGLFGGVAPGRVQLDNRDCEFAPRVQMAPVGSELEVLSSDPILHTAHAYLDGAETLFHVALPVFLSRRTVRLTRPGLVRLECDVGHTWMRAFIWVTATGFAAVSDGDGRFQLRGVPPGRYRLRVWHEVLGERWQAVNVAPGDRATVAVRFGDASPAHRNPGAAP